MAHDKTITDRLDALLDCLRTKGWTAEALTLSEPDLEAMRLETFGQTSVWVKKGGIEAYRNVPILPGPETIVSAKRDGETKQYPVM